MAENNGKMTNWLVGTLFSVVFAIIVFTGKGVVANDQLSRARDTSNKDYIGSIDIASRDRDDKIQNETSEIKGDIKGINIKIGYIKQAQVEQKTQANDMMKLLQEIHRKAV